MKIIRLLHEILREIFDESAYERFLHREKLEINRRSYARFLASGALPSNGKIRCC